MASGPCHRSARRLGDVPFGQRRAATHGRNSAARWGANLAGDAQSGIVAAGVEQPVFINRYKIDRVRLAAFLGDRLEEGLRLLAKATRETTPTQLVRDR